LTNAKTVGDKTVYDAHEVTHGRRAVFWGGWAGIGITRKWAGDPWESRRPDFFRDKSFAVTLYRREWFTVR
jgi:hypothetical protein